MGRALPLLLLLPVVLGIFVAVQPKGYVFRWPTLLKSNLDHQSALGSQTVNPDLIEHQPTPIATADVEIDTGCQLPGLIDECCNCTYAAVEALNKEQVYPILSQLVQTAFYRYFKVNVYCDCPLWPDDSMCSLQACSVCECEPSEVPQPWLEQEGRACAGSEAGAACNSTACASAQAAAVEAVVDRTVEPAIHTQLLNLKGWRGFNNPWIAEGDENEEYLYINLLVNPERYTGYDGEHAHRIWSVIYSQSCFDGITGPEALLTEQCPERRVFYRLISGMHASISAHLTYNYLLDEAKGEWGPNLAEFERRLGTPETATRVQNLYFAFLFVLRAVMKAAPLLQQYEYVTGLPEEDWQTALLMRELLGREDLHHACPVPFDEGRLWKGEEGPQLKEVLQASFRNITRTMDCVGCEKCKLWGKLQTLGVATALKILFSSSDCSGSTSSGTTLQLERNEVIALINTLARFSSSLRIFDQLSAQLQRQKGVSPNVQGRSSVA